MKLWPYLLGLWLILHGLISLVKLSFHYDHVVMASLALIAGIAIILRR